MKARHQETLMSWGIAALMLLSSGLAQAEQEGWQFPSDHQPPPGPNFIQAQPNQSGNDAQEQAPPAPEADDGVAVPDVQIPDGDEQQLAPYGTWVNDSTYGWVWQPSEDAAGADFTPYATNGDWTDTADGWSYSSYYSWGAIPFHYGRWLWLRGGGWSWLPGTTWGPAWVAWRQGGGYVGWAALGPRGYHWPAKQPGVPASPWAFLDSSLFGREGMSSHLLRGGPARGAYDSSSPVQNMVTYGGASWNAGPRLEDVIQGGGQVRSAQSARPAQLVARPAANIEASATPAPVPAPAAVVPVVQPRPVLVRPAGRSGVGSRR